MTTSLRTFIRVANVIEEAKLGGPQVRIVRIAENLSEQVETTVIMPRSNSRDFKALLRKKNIRFHLIYLTRITREPFVALQYVFCFLFEILSLYLILKKEKFDIVHVSGGAWQYKGIIAGKLAGSKVLWHLNDTSLPSIFRYIFRQLSFIPDYYVFASAKTKSYYLPLIKSPHIPTGLVRQPVDTKEFYPDAIIRSRRGKSELSDNTITIGTVANINPEKGLELFILVASKLNRLFNNLRFIVAGPVHKTQKKYFHGLLKYAEELRVKNIYFLGKSLNVRQTLLTYDVFLCTSLNESGPLTLWEAMSMEKAIVTTDVGDVREHLSCGISGDVVKVGDASAMINRTVKLIEDRSRREKYGVAARKVAIDTFDTNICAESQLDIYRELTEFD